MISYDIQGNVGMVGFLSAGVYSSHLHGTSGTELQRGDASILGIHHCAPAGGEGHGLLLPQPTIALCWPLKSCSMPWEEGCSHDLGIMCEKAVWKAACLQSSSVLILRLRGSLRLKKGGLQPLVPQEKQSRHSDTCKHDIHHRPCLCMTRQARHAHCRGFGSQYAYILRERYAWRLQADGNFLN